MRTLIPDPPPREVQALLERRRRAGLDRLDEVWEGVLHLVPAPSVAHAKVAQQLAELLGEPARAAGLSPVMHEFNVGSGIEDFRVPDGGLLSEAARGTWIATAALVVEIVSPGDESWEKLPFYAAHHVDEVLIVDPAQRGVHWLGLSGGGPGEQCDNQEARSGRYQPIERSRLIEMGATELGQRIDWP